MNPIHLIRSLWFEIVENTEKKDLHVNITSDEANQRTKFPEF